MKRNFRLFAVAALTALGFASSANAQNLVNGTDGVISNGTTGILCIKTNAGEFVNNNSTIGDITNTGTIRLEGTGNTFTGTNPLGASAATRVPGLVQYDGTGVQNVHARWYEDLQMSNSGPKSVPDLVYIGGDYTLNGTPGARTYAGTLFYDGAATQTVLAENNYVNLNFQDVGLKQISGAVTATGTSEIEGSATGGVSVTGTLNVGGAFTQAVGAGDFTMDGTGVSNLNGAGNTFNANVALNNGGDLNLNGTTTAAANSVITVDNGTLTIGATAPGDLTIADNGTLTLNNNATAALALTADGDMTVQGSFTNSFAAATNMTYNVGSTVTYDDPTTDVVATVATNQYGNVDFTGAATKTAADDFYIAGNLSVTGGNVDLEPGAGNNSLIYTNATGTITYAGLEEVIGNFRREHAFAATTDYTYNNSATTVNFGTVSTGGTFFALSVQPNTDPLNFDNTRDVRRKVTPTFDGTGGVYEATVGYRDTEANLGTWTAGFNESQIRYYENDGTLANSEKVSTGQVYARTGSTGGSFGSVSLAGITYTTNNADGNADATFKSANDLVLRAGPSIFLTVNSGRWSNPNTWDEGVQPSPTDEAWVRHTVHAGYVRPTDNYTGDETAPTQMANKIQIIDADGTYTNPALLIGSGDPTMNGGASISWGINNAGTAGIVDPGSLRVGTAGASAYTPDLSTANDGAVNTLGNGLYVFNQANFNVTQNLTNEGFIKNGGVICVGL